MTPLRAFSVSCLLLAACLGSACYSWKAWSPDQSLRDPEQVTPSRAIHLSPGASSAGDLDCKAGRCDQWFRVRVDDSGLLRVEVTLEGLAQRAVARLFLQNGSGRTLAGARSGDGLPLRVERAVEPGPYAVLLQAGGGPVSYVVETALDQTSTPPLQPGSSDPYLHHRGTLVVDLPPNNCLTSTDRRRYYREVGRAILGEWDRPAGVAAEKTVGLRVRIAESGELLEARVTTEVDSSLAAAALEAVHRAAPFPAIPYGERCRGGTALDGYLNDETGR